MDTEVQWEKLSPILFTKKYKTISYNISIFLNKYSILYIIYVVYNIPFFSSKINLKKKLL